MSKIKQFIKDRPKKKKETDTQKRTCSVWNDRHTFKLKQTEKNQTEWEQKSKHRPDQVQNRKYDYFDDEYKKQMHELDKNDDGNQSIVCWIWWHPLNQRKSEKNQRKLTTRFPFTVCLIINSKNITKPNSTGKLKAECNNKRQSWSQINQTNQFFSILLAMKDEQKEKKKEFGRNTRTSVPAVSISDA